MNIQVQARINNHTHMLSRLANHLFWMGRYLERGEHLARYVKVQYFQVLDAPREMNKELALRSIIFMVGGIKQYFQKYDKLVDEVVLQFCCFDKKNEYSITNVTNLARDNARSARDMISQESWEAINRFHHNLSTYSVSEFVHDRHYDFCQYVIENVVIVKGLLQNTLLHDSVWSMINIGIHLERAIQINQIILAKLRDIQTTNPNDLARNLLKNYHLNNLLHCAGGFDISRKMYKRLPDRHNVIELLILHPEFPKSIAYNLNALHHHIKVIQEKPGSSQDSALFHTGKLASQLQYTTTGEILANQIDYLEDLRNKLYEIGDLFESEYLSY